MKEYPTFKGGEILEVYDNLSKSEQDIIKEYLQYRAITLKSKRTLSNIQGAIVQFRYVINKSFDNISLKDLRDYLVLLNNSNREQNTKNDLKAQIKNFLKWKYKDWSSRFEDLRDIRMQKGKNEKKINSNTLLKKEDIEKIMKVENKPFWKAFFIALYESGVRPIELRLLKWSDVKLNVDGDVSELNIYATKTKKFRAVYVKEATFYLRRLQEIQDNSVYVFPSPLDINKPITKNAVCLWLKALSKKALGRTINPYLLRHSRATELYLLAKQNKISKDTATAFMGHSEDMSEFYTHLDASQIKEVLIEQVYNLQEIPPEHRGEFEEMKKQLKEIHAKLSITEKMMVLLKPYFMEAVKGKNILVDDVEVLNYLDRKK